MNSLCCLSDLEPGDKACVWQILSKGDIRRRLRDLGIIEGTVIKCVLKSPYGDPSAYYIRGAVIALRNEDAENIIVNFN